MQEEDLHIISQIKQSNDFFSKAKLLHILIYQKKNKLKDVANALGLKPSYICHILRLNRLSEIIMDGYYAKLISISHLFVISLLKSVEEQNKLYELVLRENLTVQKTEEYVRTILHGVSSEGDYIDKTTITPLLNHIQSTQGATVKLIQTRIRSKVILEWRGSRAQRKEKVLSLLKLISSRNR